MPTITNGTVFSYNIDYITPATKYSIPGYTDTVTTAG